MILCRNLLICLLLSIILFLGCSGDDDEDNGTDANLGKPPAAMVGSWIFQSVTVNGTSAPLDSVLEWHANVTQARFHIQANSAYVYEEVNSSGGQIWYENGFIFVDGNSIDINVQFDGNGAVNEMSVVTYTLNGNTLTFTENDGGTIVVFTMTM